MLSLGKLFEDHGYSYDWTNGQKPCLLKKCVRIRCNTENYVPVVVPGLSTTSSSSSASDLSLQHHFRRKVQVQHLFQGQLNVTVRTSKHDAIRDLTKRKSKNLIKMWTMNKYGESPSYSEKPRMAARIQGESRG